LIRFGTASSSEKALFLVEKASAFYCPNKPIQVALPFSPVEIEPPLFFTGIPVPEFLLAKEYASYLFGK